MFGVQRFEDDVKTKLNELEDVDELVNRRRFIEQVKNVIKKFPFLYISSFIDEWFRGTVGSELMRRYMLGNYLELNHITDNIFKLTNKRYTKKFSNAFKRNLNIYSWKEKYEDVMNNCIFFKEELNVLFFRNVLRAFILILMMDFVKNSIKRDELLLRTRTLDEHYDLFYFINDDLKKTFQHMYLPHIDQFALEVIEELILEQAILEKLDGSLLGRFSLDDIKQEIVSELELNKSAVSEGHLKMIIRGKRPGLILIPDFIIWNASLSELESNNIIKINRRSNHYSLIFLNSDYKKIQQQIKNLDQRRAKFYGRKISPDVFINELLELERGDIDDHDDQVTRVAGLIMVESIKLLRPKEITSEFDFTANITNYHFSGKQLDAMKKMGIQIDTNIIHYKVMIGEALSVQKHQDLKKTLPDGEQGIVITFEKVSESVKQILEHDKSIQIIDIDGLKTWVAITTKIPSRKNAFARIHFDPISKLEKCVVKINLIDYESSLASVSVLSTMVETTVLAGSLEEIQFEMASPKMFDVFCSNYLEFLQIMATLTTASNLAEGVFSRKILKTMSHTSRGIMYNFEYNMASLNPDSYDKKGIINCDCLKWADDSFYLCPHLVSALDHTARTGSFLGESWGEERNYLWNLLNGIVERNVSIILARLGIYHDSGGLYDELGLGDFLFGVAKIKGVV